MSKRKLLVEVEADETRCGDCELADMRGNCFLYGALEGDENDLDVRHEDCLSAERQAKGEG